MKCCLLLPSFAPPFLYRQKRLLLLIHAAGIFFLVICGLSLAKKPWKLTYKTTCSPISLLMYLHAANPFIWSPLVLVISLLLVSIFLHLQYYQHISSNSPSLKDINLACSICRKSLGHLPKIEFLILPVGQKSFRMSNTYAKCRPKQWIKGLKAALFA